jgi:hypothetical protein
MRTCSRKQNQSWPANVVWTCVYYDFVYGYFCGPNQKISFVINSRPNTQMCTCSRKQNLILDLSPLCEPVCTMILFMGIFACSLLILVFVWKK